MKKIITLFSFIIIVNFINSQVFFENWTDTQSWTENDADGDGFTWSGGDLTGGTSLLESLGEIAFSQSFDNTGGVALNPDNYLISPSIDLSSVSGALTFQFDVAAFDETTFFAENYSVYVVTDTTNLDLNLAVPLLTETLTSGGTIFTRTFDISSFAGAPQIFLVFRHHDCTDQFLLIFDNIGVYNADFASDILAGSVCQTYTFTDNSVGATSWDWNFGADATPQTANTAGPHQVTYSTPGLKTITLTTDGLVTETKTDYLSVALLEDATFSYSQTNYCVGSANEVATISGFAGGTFSSPSAGFVLDAISGEIDLANSAQAIYDVTYTTPAGACQNSSTISIEIGLDDASFSYSGIDFCNGSANEVATITGVVGGTFASTDPAFVIDATTGEIALSSSPAGTYDVTYSTPVGVCQNTETITITIFDPVVVDPILPQELCVGGMTNAITFSGAGSGAPGNTGISFDWEYTTQAIAGTDIGLPFTGNGDIPAFQTINTGTDPIIATFTITPTDGVCGGSPLTFTITVNPLDDASFSYPQTAYCFGVNADEFPINIALPGGVFSSSTPAFVDPVSGSIAVSSFPVASYDVTYTTTGVCPNSSMQIIDINAADDASFAYSALEYCQFGTNPSPVAIELGGTYSSNSADLTINASTGEIDLSNSLQGFYSITYTTSGACPDFSFQQVVVRAAAFVDPVVDVSYCEAENSAVISFTGSSATTFDWTNNNVTIGLGASGSGDIPSFVVSNGTGGAITATIEVTPDDGVCPGNPVSFDITVNISADPSFTLSSISACSGSSNVSASITGTANGIFTATGGLTIDANTGEIDVLNSMPGIYDVTYEVGTGSCQISSTLSFEIIETPVIAPIFDVTICAGDIVPNLNLDVLSAYAVEWTNDNVSTGVVNINGIGDIPSFIANNPVLGDIPQVSTITLTSNNNGCVSLPETFTVTVNPNPVVDGGVNVVQCSGLPLTLTATGTPGTIFTWDNNITQGIAFTPSEGNYIYTVTGTLNGCQSFDQVSVQINLTPTVSAGTDRVVCAGSITTLTGSGAPILTWSNGVFDNIPFLPSVTQTYTLTGQSAAGCTSTDDVEIVVEALPTPSFTADNVSACSPATIFFNSSNTTNGCVYSFSDGTTEVGCFNVAHTFTEVGTYDVTLTQSSINLCVGTITIPAMITINPDPISSFVPSKSTVDMIDPTTYFENTSAGAVSYEWDFGDNSGVNTDEDLAHTFPAEQAGQFSVRLIAISPFGCRDTSYQTILMEESLIAYIPNTFTPNGDEFNNSFSPQFYSGIDPLTFNMKIFNRFGNLIFESNDASQGWDGDYGAGRGLTNTGVYTYKIEFSTSSKDEKKMIVGNVNLLL